MIFSHDLVMDDWSVRSNSVPDTPIAETVPVELHPMQDECDETMSSGMGFVIAQIFNFSFLFKQSTVRYLYHNIVVS